MSSYPQQYPQSYDQQQQSYYQQQQSYYPQQQQSYYPQQQSYYPQPVTATVVSTTKPSTDTKKKEGWRQQYFYWFTPAMGIWFFLAFCIIILAWFTVGSSFCSVPEACGTWSFDCATSQDG